MGKYSFKNYIIICLIVLSQIHTIFRGCGFDIVWVFNDVRKTASFSVFLFVKHLTTLCFMYLIIRPKGLDKNLLLFSLIIAITDVLHFILASGFGFQYFKIGFSVLIFALIKIIKSYA